VICVWWYMDIGPANTVIVLWTSAALCVRAGCVGSRLPTGHVVYGYDLRLLHAVCEVILLHARKALKESEEGASCLSGTGAACMEVMQASQRKQHSGPPWRCVGHLLCLCLYDRPAEQLHLHLQLCRTRSESGAQGVCFDAVRMEDCVACDS